jgi:hypothetical protein
MSPGRRRIACEIAVCTSWAAESMSRFSENVSVMRELPLVEVDVISSMPEMRLNSRSSGSATVFAMISGLAPGQARGHRDSREIHVREVVDRQRGEAEPAEK